ncbi:membrane glycoprotein polyprotein [Facey's Paddock virus]|uniref:Envelopment polyprotein n=1 Tax=Facey's Paddock virus TaxID=159143 RepID=A0A023VZC4_9VIRU|nr:membrane glycoprotein polyprotein [Facey's Paddock virus]AHY22339.1 membrane glycoprotein polyprotein [Facey's Paddock virus]
MKFVSILLFVSWLGATYQNPVSHRQIGERCFAGGSLIKTVNQTSGVSEVCVRDDISMIKSIVHTTKASDTAVNNYIRFYRVFIVKEWHDCNPFPDPKGTFMVLDVSSTNHLEPITYTCRTPCEITLDKDSAEVTLSSQKMNHYEISGSTINNGWFKNSISVSLEHTCEHITVSCGQKTVRFHACFRQHRSCTRFFKNSMMPARMTESICQNLEIILLTCFSFVCFIFLCIITKTYVAYVLIPVFYPFTYIYGRLYDKYFKLCENCLLAVHPFTPCETVCVCGSQYANTEQLRTHRMTNNCKGYKSLSKSRAMCKSKGCSFVVAIFCSIIFFSFITPINSQEYKLSDLPDEFTRLEEENTMLKIRLLVIKITISVISVTITVTSLTERKVFQELFNAIYRHCPFCGMIHRRRGLRVVNSTTNKCGTCICGYKEETEHGVEYEIFLKTMHQENVNCMFKPSQRHFRNFKILIAFLAMCMIITSVSADEKHCLKYKEPVKLSNLTECHSLWLNITECQINQSTLFETLKGEQLVTDFDKPDFTIMGQKYDIAMERIENAQNLHHMILLEYLHAKSNCLKYKQLKSNSGPYNIPWRTYIHGHGLDVCGQYSYKLICKCISTGMHCENTALDIYNEMRQFYTNNQENYNLDLNTVIKAIGLAMRGIGQMIIEEFFGESQIEELSNFLNMTSKNLGTNKQLIGLINFGLMLLDINQTKTPQIDPKPRTLQARSSIPTGTEITDWTKGQSKIKTCAEYSTLTCQSWRKTVNTKSFLMCKVSSKWHVYNWPEIPTVVRNSKLCLGDYHCNMEFTPIDADEALKQLRCYKTEFVPSPDGMDESIKKCTLEKFGGCTTANGHSWTIMVCNGRYYQTNTREHAKDGLLNSYCFEPKCQSGRHPIHKSFLNNCIWKESSRQIIETRTIEYNNIEDYKKSVESDIKSDLTIHHFKPTKNLPLVTPTYISVVADGTMVSDGIQNAYVKGTIPGISGVATGLHVKTPDGILLMDIIVYVRKALYKANYEKIYSTGPTIGINVKHNEKCTGTCPEHIPKDEGWLTFSKEHTSNWGCEEYGCFAINSGCLYGSCQDIIRPELDIYKQQGEEQTLLELCITLPHETFCNDLDVLEPVITDKLQLDFQTTQSDHLPELVALKKGLILTGQLNDLGNTAAMCGSVQLVNKTIYGQGNPKFDFICHAMRRKDVIVRRCYDNHYSTCALLKQRNDLLHKEVNDQMSITVNGKNLGLINFRLNLGDLNYKLFVNEPNFELTGQCAGCISCADEISCQLNIIADHEFTCKVSSSCNLYISNMMITPANHIYNLKVSCREHVSNIDLAVCGRSFSLHATLKQHSQKLDLSALDETNFVKEEDLRCGTWLCKVKDEGLSFLTRSIFGSLGTYWSYFIYGLIFMILLFIAIYFLYPLCKRLKGLLEENEREYLIESKMK